MLNSIITIRRGIGGVGLVVGCFYVFGGNKFIFFGVGFFGFRG